MRFLFRTLLEFTTIMIGLGVAILGYLQPNSIFIIVLGIAIAVIALVMLVDDVRSHCEDRDDFRKKIIPESLAIVDYVIKDTSQSRIEYSNWQNKTEGFKKDILGEEPYTIFKRFYDAVEQRNQHHMGRDSFGRWEDFRKHNRTIFDSFFKVYDGIPWVREHVSKEHIADFQSRAKHSACV